MALNEQAKAWLESVAASGLPPLWQISVPDARATYQAVVAQCGGEPEPVTKREDRTIEGPGGPLGLRIYTPEGSGVFPVLVYLHGGGWTIGDLEVVDTICTRIANRAHAIVVSVDYRLAPEHPFPAGLQDSVAAVQWVAEHTAELNADPERIAIGGDSAGGNLATVAAKIINDGPGLGVMHQLLIYPATDFSRDTPSSRDNADGYFLTAEFLDWFAEQYAADPSDWRASPALIDSFESMPPAYIITAEYDPLRDEGEQYADQLRAAGVDVTVRRFDGQIHGFAANLGGAIEDGQRAIDEAALALRDAFRLGWRPRVWV